MKITHVEPVNLDRLTDQDAAPDGFATADLLRAELTALYGAQIEAGYQAFRIRFRVEPPAPEASGPPG